MRKSTERNRCCICGEDTAGADDYIEIEITSEVTGAQLFFGAHGRHLNEVMASDFRVGDYFWEPPAATSATRIRLTLVEGIETEGTPDPEPR